MASKSKYPDSLYSEETVDTTEAVEIESPVQAEPQQPAPATGSTVTGLVRIVNLGASNRDITLRDGTNVHLGPFRRGDHISEPIPKSNIPLFNLSGKSVAVGKMIARGEIRLEEVKS